MSLSFRSFVTMLAITLTFFGSSSPGAFANSSLFGEDGVTAKIELGDAKNPTIAKGRTSFLNITSTSQLVNQPMRFTASLGNSVSAKKVKAERKTLYVYVGTKLLLEVVSKGKPGVKTGGINLEGQACEGYKFVLYPGNDYRVSIYAEPQIRIRSKSRANTVFGTHKDDWTASRAESFAGVIAIRTKPFMVVEKGKRSRIQLASATLPTV